MYLLSWQCAILHGCPVGIKSLAENNFETGKTTRSMKEPLKVISLEYA